jgi:hypothetical protein
MLWLLASTWRTRSPTVSDAVCPVLAIGLLLDLAFVLFVSEAIEQGYHIALWLTSGVPSKPEVNHETPILHTHLEQTAIRT